MTDEEKLDEVVKELTLLLLYLTSWEEGGMAEMAPVHRAWKGYRFEVLNALADEGLLSSSRGAESVYLTDEGVTKARALQRKYLSRE